MTPDKYCVLMTDNFGMAGESPGRDEKFLLWPMPKHIAVKIATALNEDVGEMGSHYFVVVRAEYKPKVFEP